MIQHKPVLVSGVWLRKEGPIIVVLVEHEGIWKRCIVEHEEGPISHIIEPTGICGAKEDTSEKWGKR